MIQIPDDVVLVGRDGELELYATIDKEFGVLVDTARETVSEQQPLQVFFKWGNFVGATEES